MQRPNDGIKCTKKWGDPDRWVQASDVIGTHLQRQLYVLCKANEILKSQCWTSISLQQLLKDRGCSPPMPNDCNVCQEPVCLWVEVFSTGKHLLQIVSILVGQDGTDHHLMTDEMSWWRTNDGFVSTKSYMHASHDSVLWPDLCAMQSHRQYKECAWNGKHSLRCVQQAQ